MIGFLEAISRWSVPFMVVAIPLYAAYKGVKVYEVFIEGAQEGFSTAVKILPNLIAMLVAIAIFRQAGLFDILGRWLRPFTSLIGMPSEILPLALIRPFTGSGALGVTTDILQAHGPDSFIGRLASTVQGSTDTTFYIITVYFGSVGIRKTRHAIPAGLAGDIAGVIAATLICHLYFG